MENIPPTADALLQHTKRAIYQVSIWATSQYAQQQTPTPAAWGWAWDDCSKKWMPPWITQPVASNACLELVKCGCRSEKGCGAR